MNDGRDEDDFDPIMEKIYREDAEKAMKNGREAGDAKDAEIARLTALLNTPETVDFLAGVRIEAAHQRERWGTNHDGGKEPADWFWLVGYLAGKCLAAHIMGKTNMRPGIATPDVSP